MMPPAEREPGNTRDWHAALDSWYIDSLAVVDPTADIAQDALKTLRRSARQTWESHLKRLASLRRMGKQPDGPTPFVTAESFDSTIDSLAATYELRWRRRRDEIKAEYRAGLVAGGEQLDATGWNGSLIKFDCGPTTTPSPTHSLGSTSRAFANDSNHCPRTGTQRPKQWRAVVHRLHGWRSQLRCD
jgi:hypothetical protein